MSGQVFALGKNALIYGLGTTATRFISLLLLPFFTAWLTPADFGVLTMLTLISQVVQPLFSFGVAAGMGPCYFDGDNNQQKAATVWTAFVLLVGSSLLLTVIAFIASDYLSILVFASNEYTSALELTLLGVAINQLSTPFMLRLQFDNRAISFVMLSIATVIATIITSVILVAALSLGVRGMILGQLVGQVVAACSAFFWARYGFKFQVSREVLVGLLRVGVPLIPGFIFLLVLLHGNKYVLQGLRGLESVGIYAIGFNLGMAVTVLVGAIQTAWYPYFMSFLSRQDRASELFGRIFTYYSVGVGAVVLLFYLFAQPVVHLLTQAAFHDAFRVVGLIATAQYFIGMFSLLLPPLYFAREVAYVSIAQGIAAAVVILLSLLLIPSLSYLGAALALAIGAASMVIALFLWQKIRSERYMVVHYEGARLFKFFGVFLTFSVVLLLPYQFSWTAQCIIIPVSLTAILASVYRILSAPERHILREMVLGRVMGIRLR